MTGKRIIMLWGVAFLAAGNWAAPWAYGQQARRTTIRLHREASVCDGPVRLGDVARIEAATAEQAQELAALAVVALSGPDSTATVGPFEIESTLRQAGMDPVAVDIFGASFCQLRGALASSEAHDGETAMAAGPAEQIVEQAAPVEPGIGGETLLEQVDVSEPNTLAAQLTRALSRLSGYELGRLKVRWDCSDPGWLERPADEARYEVRPQSALRLGAVRFEVADKAAADGVADETVPASWPTVRLRGYVELMCQAVVATRDMLPAQVITKADVKLMPQRIDNLRDLGFLRVEDVLGKEVARPIGHGQKISAEEIRTLLFVKRNQVVTLRSRSGSVEITLHGRALKDAGLDDAVTVCYGPKRTKVEGHVTGMGEVTIGFGSSPERAVSVGSPRGAGDESGLMAYRGPGERR